MLIYLSGTIDGISHNESTLWRKYIQMTYPKFKYHDPTKRIFAQYHPEAKEIVEPDKKEILESDIVFVYFTKMSAGTLMEIMYAYDHNKPVILVNASTIEHLSAWIRYHCKIFNNIEDAFSYIQHKLNTPIR